MPAILLAGIRLVGVCADQAGIRRERAAAYKPFGDAAGDDGLEQMPEKVAIAKALVPVLGKCGTVRQIARQDETIKPTIGEVQVSPLAEPPS